MNAADNHQPTGTSWYTVEVRQYTDAHEGASKIGGLRVQAIKFTVDQQPRKIPAGEQVDTSVSLQRYDAAVTAMGAIANGTDWPAGTYLATVEGRHSSTAYLVRLGEHREFNLEVASPADWAF